jgi:hypothetical protein
MTPCAAGGKPRPAHSASHGSSDCRRGHSSYRRLEQLLKSVDDKGLQSSMLTTRGLEKDFIMRRDAKYVARHAEERTARPAYRSAPLACGNVAVAQEWTEF